MELTLLAILTIPYASHQVLLVSTQRKGLVIVALYLNYSVSLSYRKSFYFKAIGGGKTLFLQKLILAFILKF